MSIQPMLVVPVAAVDNCHAVTVLNAFLPLTTVVPLKVTTSLIDTPYSSVPKAVTVMARPELSVVLDET